MRRGGLTLVEVVAGLVLMATLLVTLVKGTAVHRRNVMLAEDRLIAIQFADEFLTRWLADHRALPTTQTGPVAGQKNWVWQIRPLRAQNVAGVAATVWRLDIQRIRPDETTLLASVDLLREAVPREGRR